MQPATFPVLAAGSTAAVWRLEVDLPPAVAGPVPLLSHRDGGHLDLLPRDGGAWLRWTLLLEPPAAVIAQRRRDGANVPAEMAAGVMVLDHPLPAARLGGRCAITLRLRPAKAELIVDGVVVDEEWPWTGLAGAHAPVAGAAVRSLRVDAGEVPGAELIDAEPAAADRVLGPQPMGTAYWRPRGHNTSAGDVMLCVEDGLLHLFWLPDRRGHRSKWGVGAHQIHHLVTADLRRWRVAPPAVEIEEPWEAIGTGTAVLADGRIHVFYDNHGERFGMPRGLGVAVRGDDGIFHKEAGCRADLWQPGVFRADGAWHLISAQRRFTSADLRSWTLADPAFVDLGSATEECPCCFTVGRRSYLLMGRTGFWMSDTAVGPYRVRPRWAPYDGLMVPMAATFGGRTLLAGWLCDLHAFGGSIVLRELHQRDDGLLASAWLPEAVPAGGDWRSVALAPVARADSWRSLGEAVLPPAPWHLRLRLDVAPGARCIAMAIGCRSGHVGGVELRLEPAAEAAQWGTPDGGPAPVSSLPVEWGRDFRLSPVEGLSGPLTIDLIAMPDARGTVIVDAQLSCGRTMISRREAFPNDRLSLLADGQVALVGAELRELAGR